MIEKHEMKKERNKRRNKRDQLRRYVERLNRAKANRVPASKRLPRIAKKMRKELRSYAISLFEIKKKYGNLDAKSLERIVRKKCQAKF